LADAIVDTIAITVGDKSNPANIKKSTKTLLALIYQPCFKVMSKDKWGADFPQNQNYLPVCPVEYMTTCYGRAFE